MDKRGTCMEQPPAETPVDAPPPPNKGGRVRRFLLDILALKALMLGLAVCVGWVISLFYSGDVTDVRGLELRVVACVFFFRVFQLYAAVTLLVVGLVVLLMKYRKIAALNLMLALILGLPFLRGYLPKSPPPVTGQTLKIYSGNLFASNRDGMAILKSIRDEDPDVIVLLEVTNWSHSLIVKEFGNAYPYVHRPRYNGGGMILSRVPFREERPVVTLKGNHSRVPLVFDLGGREFAMYPVHLLSPGSLKLIAQHREQIREFLEIEKAEERPMVIVGDCNMTPRTPNYEALGNVGFRSTYELAGSGLGNTWGPRWWPRLYQLPGVQIDQMLLQQPLTAKWHRVGADTGSDHRPIVAEIGFAADARK